MFFATFYDTSFTDTCVTAHLLQKEQFPIIFNHSTMNIRRGHGEIDHYEAEHYQFQLLLFHCLNSLSGRQAYNMRKILYLSKIVSEGVSVREEQDVNCGVPLTLMIIMSISC